MSDLVSLESPVKLILGHGHFVVLDDNGVIQTCYTDRTDTSRSSVCTAAELVKFAKDVLLRFGQDKVTVDAMVAAP